MTDSHPHRKTGIMSGLPLADEPTELDRSLRPTRMSEFVGQPQVLEQLSLAIEATSPTDSCALKLNFLSRRLHARTTQPMRGATIRNVRLSCQLLMNMTARRPAISETSLMNVSSA